MAPGPGSAMYSNPHPHPYPPPYPYPYPPPPHYAHAPPPPYGGMGLMDREKIVQFARMGLMPNDYNVRNFMSDVFPNFRRPGQGRKTRNSYHSSSPRRPKTKWKPSRRSDVPVHSETMYGNPRKNRRHSAGSGGPHPPRPAPHEWGRRDWNASQYKPPHGQPSPAAGRRTSSGSDTRNSDARRSLPNGPATEVRRSPRKLAQQPEYVLQREKSPRKFSPRKLPVVENEFTTGDVKVTGEVLSESALKVCAPARHSRQPSAAVRRSPRKTDGQRANLQLQLPPWNTGADEHDSRHVSAAPAPAPVDPDTVEDEPWSGLVRRHHDWPAFHSERKRSCSPSTFDSESIVLHLSSEDEDNLDRCAGPPAPTSVIHLSSDDEDEGNDVSGDTSRTSVNSVIHLADLTSSSLATSASESTPTPSSQETNEDRREKKTRRRSSIDEERESPPTTRNSVRRTRKDWASMSVQSYAEGRRRSKGADLLLGSANTPDKWGRARKSVRTAVPEQSKVGARSVPASPGKGQPRSVAQDYRRSRSRSVAPEDFHRRAEIRSPRQSPEPVPSGSDENRFRRARSVAAECSSGTSDSDPLRLLPDQSAIDDDNSKRSLERNNSNTGSITPRLSPQRGSPAVSERSSKRRARSVAPEGLDSSADLTISTSSQHESPAVSKRSSRSRVRSVAPDRLNSSTEGTHSRLSPLRESSAVSEKPSRKSRARSVAPERLNSSADPNLSRPSSQQESPAVSDTSARSRRRSVAPERLNSSADSTLSRSFSQHESPALSERSSRSRARSLAPERLNSSEESTLSRLSPLRESSAVSERPPRTSRARSVAPERLNGSADFSRSPKASPKKESRFRSRARSSARELPESRRGESPSREKSDCPTSRSEEGDTAQEEIPVVCLEILSDERIQDITGSNNEHTASGSVQAKSPRSSSNSSRQAEVIPVVSPRKRRTSLSPKNSPGKRRRLSDSKAVPFMDALTLVERKVEELSELSDLSERAAPAATAAAVVPATSPRAAPRSPEKTQEKEETKIQKPKQKDPYQYVSYVFCEVLNQALIRHPVQKSVPQDKWWKWMNPRQMTYLVARMLENTDLCLRYSPDGEMNDKWEKLWEQWATRLNVICYRNDTGLNTGLIMTVNEWKQTWMLYKQSMLTMLDTQTPEMKHHNLGKLECLLMGQEMFDSLKESKGACLGPHCPRIWCSTRPWIVKGELCIWDTVTKRLKFEKLVK